MAYSYSLLSPPETLRAINQAGASNKRTNDINDALFAASEEIQSFLGRDIVKLSAKHWIEYHERSRTEPTVLSVLHWPIDTSWGSIEICEDSSRAYGASTVLVNGTDYRIVHKGNQTSEIIRLSGDSETSWLSGYEAIRITIKGGWAQVDVPPTIKRVCREFLARQYHATVNQDYAFKTIDDARGTVTHFGPVMLTKPQRSALAEYADHGASTCVRFTEEDDA
ncbi:MAG: hypothetical protein JSV16_08020 [Candidatus Hydrogenedentota bacterium]|nr:MAG: hypothetical protein JSV16_08020 [Candidatus Hydrogenedentota bacterium]